jgi:hypothetical protein
MATTPQPTTTISHELADSLDMLAQQRAFLRQTVQGLTDEQAARRTTVSELCLGGLIKHVSFVEAGWAAFIVNGPSALGGTDPAFVQTHTDSFRMLAGETLPVLLERYEQTAQRTQAVLAQLDSFDRSHPLPEAPWFPPNSSWSARRAVMHIVAETAQHAGHADIIREALDGAKTMG